MMRRSGTPTILIALIITSVAAVALWSLQRQAIAQLEIQQVLSTRTRDALRTLMTIASVQQGYVAPGQLDSPLFEQMAALLPRLQAEADAVTSGSRSRPAAAPRQSLHAAIDALADADARARSNLALGHDLMAADVVYSDARNLVDSIARSLADIESAEQTELTAASHRRSALLWGLFGALTVVWACACLGASRQRQVAVSPPAALEPPPAARETTSSSVVNRMELAALCTDLSRVSDAGTLETLLQRAAAVLQASGLMLWMSAGDRLFPVLAHGYPREMMPRLGSIARDARHATADAWREGRQVFQPGTADRPAALVTPLFGPEACIGVLAIELSNDGLPEDDLKSAAAVLAAQLATVVSAWPAASTPDSGRGRARTA